ncbi:glycine oxidase ThiO [Nitrosomonas sp. Nm33]|uniref:glycine oxidase ThiO n=1 Tax=Nitrosomonas sp. Nm33 TaxID=133724 RepID=UPI0008979A58|nr:glycine oxidase ThiO [Nitrosomonas sp. Nm33]SDY37763.1 glycine oxidase [Nitrosomonas sp. Nm33]
MNEVTPDFIVIGAGVIGLATAVQLLKEGATVTILERAKVGQESSWAGGGILSPLCPWSYLDSVTRLADYSAAMFPAWVAELYASTGIDAEYVVSGMLVLPPYDANAAQKWLAEQKVFIQMAPLSEQINFLHLKVEHSLFLPHIAQVRNPRLLKALYNQVVQLGGRIIEHCEVQEIITQHHRLHSLTTSCGKYCAAHFVITAGAWNKQVLGKHALNLEIKPIRGQMLLYKFEEPPLGSILLQGDVYLIPRRDGYLLVGSTMEDVGFNKQTTLAAREHLSGRAQKLLPQLKGRPLIKHWAGLRPASPHNIPTIGRHPLLNNLFINSGHFRYGITMAPGSAKILLNEIMGRPQPFDTSPYQKGWGVY